MAETSKKVSELETAAQVNNTDLVMLSQGSSGSGFASLKTTILAIAQKIVSGINFTSDLQTVDKTIVGAINEAAASGGTGAIADTFGTTQTYDVGDYVIYEGSLYKCTTAVSVAGQWDENDWTETLVMDEVEQGGGGGGTTVIANPTGEATDELEKLQVGSIIYSISSGGSGEDSGLTKTTLYTGTSFPEENASIQLSDSIDSYDYIEFDTGHNTQHFNYTFTPEQLKDTTNNGCWMFTDGGYACLQANSTGDEITFFDYSNWSNKTLLGVYGLKFSGSSASWKDITGVLIAGQTSITLSDASITTNSTVEPFTDKFGINPTNIEIIVIQELINDILSSADDTKVTASSFDTAEVAPWEAFDGIKGVSSGTYTSPYHAWLPSNGDAPCWLQYHFDTAKYIDEVKVYVYCNNGTYTGSAKIQGSNNGTSWTDISSAVSISAPYGEEIELDFTCDSNQYSYVRLYSESTFTVYGGASIFVGEMEIYGRNGVNGVKLTFPVQSENLNVKVRVS